MECRNALVREGRPDPCIQPAYSLPAGMRVRVDEQHVRTRRHARREGMLPRHVQEDAVLGVQDVLDKSLASGIRIDGVERRPDELRQERQRPCADSMPGPELHDHRGLDRAPEGVEQRKVIQDVRAGRVGDSLGRRRPRFGELPGLCPLLRIDDRSSVHIHAARVESLPPLGLVYPVPSPNTCRG